MLTYRSFFHVHDEPRLLELSAEQLHAWLRRKGWTEHDLIDGEVVDLAAGVRGIFLSDSPRDGSRTNRYRFVQDSASGLWTTELTVHTERLDRQGWVWLDVQSPESGPAAKPPGLARDLLTVLRGRDGAHELTSQPTICRLDDLDDVVANVTDPHRRGLLFLAGSSDDLPFDSWSKHVATMLRDTVGLASARVLDSATTAAFNERVPDSHSLRAGTVRTYQPEVRIHDPLDSVRHRILSTARIVRDDARALSRLLGHRARDLTLTSPLPSNVVRLDRRLREQLDAQLVQRVEPRELPREPTEPKATPPGNVLAVLSDVLLQVTGDKTVSDIAVRKLGDLAVDARRLAQAGADLRLRLRGLEDQTDLAKTTTETIRQQLDDEKQERALAEHDRAESERQLRRLRSEMAKAGRAELAWSVEAPEPKDVRPDSFDELLIRFDELRYVTFTGDPEHTNELDEYDPLGAWAGKCWEALLALDDYARLTVTERWSGNVERYLSYGPDGCRGFPANRYARDESADVQQNPKFRTPRTLPVPTSVDSSGKLFMGAHFKIAQFGLISPRMHYYDDTARTERIYVGYIGRHLPTAKTN